MIAVTGATGFVGGAVARVLAERGVAQRLVVREPARAPQLERAEVRVARAYGDADAMRAALDGVETLFLVPAEEATDRVTQHRTAIDAAVAAGVRRIVYLSFLGVIAGPAGERRAGIVSRADVADVVVGLLTSGGHDGATYDVTGREALTVGEMAATLARCSGRPIAYKDETLEEARASRASYGAPAWQVDAWISTYTAIAAGELDRVTDTVERLTGHPPVTLAEFVRADPECLD